MEVPDRRWQQMAATQRGNVISERKLKTKMKENVNECDNGNSIEVSEAIPIHMKMEEISIGMRMLVLCLFVNTRMSINVWHRANVEGHFRFENENWIDILYFAVVCLCVHCKLV